MIRPALARRSSALRRALRSAQVAADDVKAVLLVGGSSRIPLVAQMVGAELGRPVRSTPTRSTPIALGRGPCCRRVRASGRAAAVTAPAREAAAAAGAAGAAAVLAARRSRGVGRADRGARPRLPEKVREDGAGGDATQPAMTLVRRWRTWERRAAATAWAVYGRGGGPDDNSAAGGGW